MRAAVTGPRRSTTAGPRLPPGALPGLAGQGHEDRVHAGAVHRYRLGRQPGVAQGHEHLGGHGRLGQGRLQVGALVDDGRRVTGHPLDDRCGGGLVLGRGRGQDEGAGAHPVLEVVRGALGDEPAAVDDADLVGQAVGLLQVLRGQKDRGAAVHQRADDVPHLLARARVQPGGGLIEEDQRRPGDQRDGQIQAAPHAAGVAAHLLAAGLGQAEGCQELVGPFAGPAPAQAQQAPEESKVLNPGEHLIDAGVLARHPDDAAHRVALADNVVPQDPGGAATGRQQRGDHAQRRGLPGAVGSQQAVDDARRDRQVQGVDGGERAESAGQAGGLDGRTGRRTRGYL